MVKGPHADSFISATKNALEKVDSQLMLTQGIADAYEQGKSEVSAISDVSQLLSSSCDSRSATPSLFSVSGKSWLNNPTLAEEVFGPLGIVVMADDEAQMTAIATAIVGQITCTLHLDDEDKVLGQKLLPILERCAGRILANGFPTGVEVVDSMVHGGPFPASTNFGATSVGTLSIRRFLRPVCYQNLPESLLPKDLQNYASGGNPNETA